MHIHEKLYINGQWIESKGTDKIQVIDPSTEEICGEVPCGNDEDVNAAVAAAKEAFKTWGESPASMRSDLIKKLADDNPHLYYRDVEKIVGTIFDEIIIALENGNRVELRGFGAFSTKDRRARRARNPKTGSDVEVNQKTIPFFKCGKGLRQKLNEA